MDFHVNEIFRSIQGEGLRAGAPSTFVRLQGCSVGCLWCDTKRSWDADRGTRYDLTNLDWAVNKFKAPELVLTGGEPFERPEESLLILDRYEFAHKTVETAGHLFIEQALDYLQLLSLSPKLFILGDTGSRRKMTLVNSTFCWLDSAARKGVPVQIKLVVQTMYDVTQAFSWFDQFKLMAPGFVGFVQPELNTAPGVVRDMCKVVAEDGRYRFLPQIHALIKVRLCTPPANGAVLCSSTLLAHTCQMGGSSRLKRYRLEAC